MAKTDKWGNTIGPNGKPYELPPVGKVTLRPDDKVVYGKRKDRRGVIQSIYSRKDPHGERINQATILYLGDKKGAGGWTQIGVRLDELVLADEETTKMIEKELKAREKQRRDGAKAEAKRRKEWEKRDKEEARKRKKEAAKEAAEKAKAEADRQKAWSRDAKKARSRVSPSGAKSYQDDLLEVGVGIPAKGVDLRKVVKESGGNPSRDVHGLAVEDVILCGLFKSGGKDILILPPEIEVFEAVIDFLWFEAMKIESEAMLGLADKTEARVPKIVAQLRDLASAIDGAAFDSHLAGDMKESVAEGTLLAMNVGDKPKMFPLSDGVDAIDCWAVHRTKEVKDGKLVDSGTYFQVTHRLVGRSAAGELSKKKAIELANMLAASHFPWRLVYGDGSSLENPEWGGAARTFYQEAVRAVKQKKSAEKAANPGCQLPLQFGQTQLPLEF